MPGDELILRGGTYSLSSRFAITAVGTDTQPITIRNKPGESPLIDMTTGSQNIVEIERSRYLVLRGLRFTHGSHGIRLMDSDFVTIEDCEVFETGDVAISANSGGTYEGLVIRRNHIHHTNGTGEGMYLGCNSNACRVANSLIERNYVHHTNRATVEQGDGIELKEGSFGNVIRDNVIHDTNYPGIITYSTVGNGPPNVIEANIIWNTNDNAIQSAADAIIRNNIVLGAPIALQSHQAGSPSNQMVVHNTVIVDGSGIDVRNVVGPVVIANNAVYSRTGPAIRLISGNLGLVTVAGNVGAGGISGTGSGYSEGGGITADFVAAHFNGAPPIDVFPRNGSALIGRGSASYVAAFDFNGTARNGATDAGAYKFDSNGNPGWVLAAGFKTVNGVVRPNPPKDVTAR
jgi:Right handed beta helix region